jgi:hypothetical protein
MPTKLTVSWPTAEMSLDLVDWKSLLCPGCRSYPVIWSTPEIVYAGQRLAAWSDGRKALVTRLAAEPRFELRGLLNSLVTCEHLACAAPSWRRT